MLADSTHRGRWHIGVLVAPLLSFYKKIDKPVMMNGPGRLGQARPDRSRGADRDRGLVTRGSPPG
jgi:hypothetical protein